MGVTAAEACPWGPAALAPGPHLCARSTIPKFLSETGFPETASFQSCSQWPSGEGTLPWASLDSP